MKKLILLLLFTVQCLAIEFNQSALVGVTLELVDDQRIGVYKFLDNGDVVATIGTKKGSICAPIMQWKVERGRLCIFDESELDVYTLKEETGEFIIVSDGKGTKLRFNRIKKK
jgi:hypothetical protein